MTFHIVPQCGMTSPQNGENPEAVSILHGDDRGDMDHSELCSVRYQGVCQLSMDIAGTVGSASKCRKASTL